MKLKVSEVIAMTAPMRNAASGHPNGSGQSALGALGDADVPVDVTYRVLQFEEHLSAAVKRYDEIRIKLNEKYRDLDEDAGRYLPRSDEDEEAFEEAFQKLLEYEIDVPRDPLEWDELKEAGLPASVLRPLRPIIDGLGENLPDDYDPLAGFAEGLDLSED